MADRRRKPIGVWMLLRDGSPWMFDRFRTLADAMPTARALRGYPPLLADTSVWIAAANQPQCIVPRAKR